MRVSKTGCPFANMMISNELFLLFIVRLTLLELI
jgi:hypothetical protein